MTTADTAKRRTLQNVTHVSVSLVAIIILIFFSACGSDTAARTNTSTDTSAVAASGARSRAIGFGYYGMQHPRWPCAQSLALLSTQARPAVSVVWNVFGRDFSCLESFVHTPIASAANPKVVEIHLVNACCQRNRNCQSYDFLYNISTSQEHSLISRRNAKFRRALINYVAPVVRFVQKHQNTDTRFIISPELESNLSAADGAVLIDWLRQVFPTTTKFAWTAIRGARPSGAHFQESHGFPIALQSPCIVNNDGYDIDLPIAGRKPYTPNGVIAYNSIPRFLSNSANCAASMLWIAEFNGMSSSGGSVNRRARTHWPTGAEFDALAAAMPLIISAGSAE